MNETFFHGQPSLIVSIVMRGSNKNDSARNAC